MKALMIILFTLFSKFSSAQKTEEFLKQKETQKTYLLEQVAALKLYAGLLKDGYSVVNKGIKSIMKFTNGELDLHTAFFNSLKAVNPAVANNWKVTEVIKLQSAVNKAFRLSHQLKVSSVERSYFESVRSKILNECSNDVDELLLLISSEKLQMKDDERIYRIDNLYERMSDKYDFTKSFISQIKQLSQQRTQDKRDLKASEKINQLKN
jgi:hypothetical protein